MITTNDVHYSSPATYKNSSDVWLKNFEDKLELGLDNMAQAVLARSLITVPRSASLTGGSLTNTGRVEGEGLEREVIYGDEAHRYAAYQERGERFDGTHKVRNYTTPGTGSKYLLNAFESVLNEGIGSYIK